ncbi:MAG: cytochrome c [Desulfocapsaceae bacterium]|nr:cytochrome c [Desulfocapsaceae bacterium]
MNVSSMLALLTVGFTVTMTSHPAFTETADTAVEPLVLRKIMRELGKNMQQISDSIARENWALITKIALRIADHPKPPLTEKIRILAFIGSDAGKFRDYDEKTHQAGQELRRAAMQEDRTEVISAFATLQESCVTCHQSFRKSFQENFYEQR